VHHALVNVIEPIFERKFIFDTYANRKGKGAHAALDRCTHYMRRFAYVLPLDVRQFFPSIDHAVLLANLAKNLQNERILGLCRLILVSGEDVLQEEYEPVYFPGSGSVASDRFLCHFVITYQLPTNHPYFVIASRRRRRSNPHIGQEIASLRSQ